MPSSAEGDSFPARSMTDAELFGSVLYSVDDATQASIILAHLLQAPRTDHVLAARAGLDPVLVDTLRGVDLTGGTSIENACALGAAWVLGRRSAPVAVPWEAVASMPAHLKLPIGLQRTTAESLIGIANGAESRVRLSAPFIDEQGLGYLTDSLVAATLRGVRVELFRPRMGVRERESVSILIDRVRAKGAPSCFRILDPLEGALFPHLKVMTGDGSVAYVGSANLTDAALAGRNLEIGVLVHGSQVQIVDSFLDLYTRTLRDEATL